MAEPTTDFDALLADYLAGCRVRVRYRHHETAAWKTGEMVDQPFTAEDGGRWQPIAPDFRSESAPTTDTAPIRSTCLEIVEIVLPGGGSTSNEAEPTTPTDVAFLPMVPLMRAARRAAELQAAAAPEGYASGAPTVLRGAPTHTGAYLLRALEEAGWTLVEKGEIGARDERVLDLEAEIASLRERPPSPAPSDFTGCYTGYDDSPDRKEVFDARTHTQEEAVAEYRAITGLTEAEVSVQLRFARWLTDAETWEYDAERWHERWLEDHWDEGTQGLPPDPPDSPPENYEPDEDTPCWTLRCEGMDADAAPVWLCFERESVEGGGEHGA